MSEWGRFCGCDESHPAYVTEHGNVWLRRRGQHCRFYTWNGRQVGPEQRNVAPAVAYALSRGWPMGF